MAAVVFGLMLMAKPREKVIFGTIFWVGVGSSAGTWVARNSVAPDAAQRPFNDALQSRGHLTSRSGVAFWVPSTRHGRCGASGTRIHSTRDLSLCTTSLSRSQIRLR